jgi:polysaccharide biosynthesis protein PslH
MKVLWIASDVLHPQDRGGRIRTLHIAESLNPVWNQFYIGLGRDDTQEARSKANLYSQRFECIEHNDPVSLFQQVVCGLKSLCSLQPIAVVKMNSSRMRAANRKAIEEFKPDVVICDFVQSMVNVPEIGNAKLVLFQHNAEADLWKRRFDAISSFGPRKLLAWLQWKTLLRFEGNAIQRSDLTICVSDDDANVMKTSYVGAKNLAVIPTSVDVNRIKFDWNPNYEKPYILFVGSLDWQPNVDGLIWFIKNCWPQVLEKLPQLELQIVGKNPDALLIECAAATKQVKVVGRVKEVAPFLQNACASVVPLLTGSGTRMKIFESFASGVPVISTTIGAEGLEIKSGVHAHIVDTPNDFTAAVIATVTNPTGALKVSKAARELVELKYSASHAADVFKQSCESLLRH